jgi:molecular chaperone GrpE (heat shock protein)
MRRRYAPCLETELAALRARAERAEAELATERARLADLVADLSDACITLESAENDCDDYAMQNTAFKLMAVRNVFAAMKEGAK